MLDGSTDIIRDFCEVVLAVADYRERAERLKTREYELVEQRAGLNGQLRRLRRQRRRLLTSETILAEVEGIDEEA